MKRRKKYKTFVMVAIVLSMMTTLLATPTQRIIDALEQTKDLCVEEVFSGEALSTISNSTIYRATYGFSVSESVSNISLTRHFLQDGDTLTPFSTEYSLFSSSEFLDTIKDDFFLKGTEDGLLFQQFLYAVDDNYFNEGFFVTGNTWVFVRDEFFGDIEAWIVKTDNNGSITTISHDYATEIIIGDELFKDMDGDFIYSERENAPPSVSILSQIQAIMTEEFDYEVEVTPITSQWLAKVSKATWYSCEISITEEYDDMTSISRYELFAFASEGDVHMFEEFDKLLTSSVYIESIQPDFFLTDDASAELFELALDQVSDFDRKEKARFERNGSWVFIRSEFFDNGTGYIIDTDDRGKITNITYHFEIPLEGVEVPIEEPFDESEVIWTFTLLEPSYEEIQIPEAQDIYVSIEFNDWAAKQIGAWIGTYQEDELVGYYAGTDMTSPFYDLIPKECLFSGENRISYRLLRFDGDPIAIHRPFCLDW